MRNLLLLFTAGVGSQTPSQLGTKAKHQFLSTTTDLRLKVNKH